MSAPTLSTIKLKLDSDGRFPLWNRMKTMGSVRGTAPPARFAPVMLKGLRLEVLENRKWKEKLTHAEDIRARRVCQQFPFSPKQLKFSSVKRCVILSDR
jgi:hypothetical protein